jgi:hypothetical protein
MAPRSDAVLIGRYAKSGAGHSIAERDRAYSQYVVMNIVDKLGVY